VSEEPSARGLESPGSAGDSSRQQVSESPQTVKVDDVGDESPSARAERLDLYKFGVEMADRISARRGTANSFFLTVSTALATVVGILASGNADASGSNRQRFASLVISGVGTVFSLTWWLLLRSYRDLSRAKWDVINRLEDRMEIRLYQDEWKILKAEQPRQPWRRRYRELGLIERVVPLLFLAVYVTFLVWIGVS
jgi:hypothetical protein